MTLALLCSGQGLQGPGLLDIVAGEVLARPVLEAAAGLLGHGPDLRHIVPPDGLFDNRVGQILCVTRALAVAAALDPLPQVLVAGYSVGEMAAWSIAGLWPAPEALRLVARRAELMDAADGGVGGLGFVRGLDRPVVERLVAAQGCAVAIVNPGRLFVIGGPRQAVAACCSAALALGAAAAGRIDVNVASHTPGLAQAVAPFETEIRASRGERRRADRILLGAANTSVVSSVDRGAAGLARQLATTVDWAATLEAIVERGADRVLELGPGDALTRMARAAYPAIQARAVDDFRSLEGVRRWLAG